MKAVVTSTGEPTTKLCVWSLERLGFEVVVHESDDTLWHKLKRIYVHSAPQDVLRVDADVVVNRNVLELIKQKDVWWYQGLTYDWFKQDITHGGVQFVRAETWPAIWKHLLEAKEQERPEAYLSRLPELHNPRMFQTFEKICGLNGYKQGDFVKRVKATKMRRNYYEDYDWELAKAIEKL